MSNFDFNKFTEKSREAVASAQALAQKRGNPTIETRHLLGALVAQQGGVTPALLEKAGVQIAAVELALDREPSKLPSVSGSGHVQQGAVSGALHAALGRAGDIAGDMGDEFVSAEHLFLALLEADDLKVFFKSFGLEKKKTLEALK